jgi:hypothetical protein
MSKGKIALTVIVFLLAFLLTDLIYPEIFSYKIVSYLVLASGFSLWFYSERSQNSAGIFSGSFIFFTGIILFVISNFTIWNPSRIIFPALLISLGLAALFSFIGDRKFFYLLFSIIFLLLGFNFLYARMNFKFNVFLSAIPGLIVAVGLIVIVAFLILLFFFNKRPNRDVFRENESDDRKDSDIF